MRELKKDYWKGGSQLDVDSILGKSLTALRVIEFMKDTKVVTIYDLQEIGFNDAQITVLLSE